MQRITLSRHLWVGVAIFVTLITAPIAVLLKIGSDISGVWVWTMTRFLVIFLMCLPFMIAYRKHYLDSWRSFRTMLISSVLMATAVVTYILAIANSNASFMVIFSLMSPVFLVILGSRAFKEKLTHRTVVGIGTALVGGLTLAFLPVLMSGGVGFYPMAALFGLANVLAYSSGMIYFRKNSERGVPVLVLTGYAGLLGSVVTYVFMTFSNEVFNFNFSPVYIFALFYTTAVVELVARTLNVQAFKRVGSSLIAGLAYVEILLAIIISVLVLEEQITPSMGIGAILILLGVYKIETESSLSSRIVKKVAHKMADLKVKKRPKKLLRKK